MPKKLDLKEVNPVGRFDVLAYRAAEKLTGVIEQKTGLQGIWPAVESEVQKLVVRGLTGIEIPTHCRILLAIMQANMIKEQVQEKLWQRQTK